MLRRSVFRSPITGRVWKVTGSPGILLLNVDRSLRWITHSRTDNLSKHSSFPTYCGESNEWRTPTRVGHFFLKDNVCTVVVCNSPPGFGLFMPVETAFRFGRLVIKFESSFTLGFFALL